MNTKLLLLLPLLTLACRGTDVDDTGLPPDIDTDTGTGTDTDTDTDPDDDGDGFAASVDCDDANADVNPDAAEVCDGVDNDCNGTADDDATDAVTWYADADADGFGIEGDTVEACDAPDGYADASGDCDDARADINPDAPETDCADATDYNCDGSTGFADADADGFAACEDCDDNSAEINSAADELCDGVDNDCDGDTDEDDATDTSTFYVDTDGDGFGAADTAVQACAAPDGYVADATDCDDAQALVNPDADEVCDELDNDCDGETNEDAVDVSTFYADTDGDGFGDDGAAVQACSAPDGHVTDATDCDDTQALVSPDAAEVCDSIDNDCDGTTDEDDATDVNTYYADTDGDGFGDADATAQACATPDGYVSDLTDCDDADNAVNPDADERCDSIDNDCDGTTDEDDAVDATTWYLDADGDDYGRESTVACEAPTDHIGTGGDCDDSDDQVNPGVADDICDGIDNNCNNTIDDDATALGEGSLCPADSCFEVLNLNEAVSDGVYWLSSPDGPFEAACDMTTDGGGWTLLGTIKNQGSRGWSTLEAFTDESTFGDLSAPLEDFKGPAWAHTQGEDLLIRTDEYAFGFFDLLTSRSFGPMISEDWPDACNETFLRSGADYGEQLDDEQLDLMSFILRPRDTNASCFPSTNENAVIGNMVTTAWTPGLGNCLNCQGSWRTHDLSLMKRDRVVPQECTGGYPCNENGLRQNAAFNCYDASCNVSWAQVYVR